MSGQLHIGCPIWACEQWKGSLFTRKAPRREWLSQYSSIFNAVEGNSTFYSLPAVETVQRWADQTSDGFRFCLKFPRAISHEQSLKGAEIETGAFLDALAVLRNADRLGPAFLQLGPQFSADEFPILEAYLARLPEEFPFALEVRHRSWFDDGVNERQLVDLLTELGMDWTIFDSRPLYSAPPTTENERVSQTRKPRTPLRTTVTGSSPLLRFVGRDDPASVQPWIDEWAPIVARWLRDGKSPFVFTHAPDDFYAPQLAVRFHEAILPLVPEFDPLPDWPGQSEDQENISRQQLLF